MAVGADKRSLRGRNLMLFAVVAVLWLGADIATKAYFNGFPAGSVVAGPFLGIVQFRVAYNTGAAWGMFGDSTFALGILSVVVCAALGAYLLVIARRANGAEVLGCALIVAGGLGNALDRFTLGYVVDFIDTTFIEFPTFNVADIGVTCGFVLFFGGMLWNMRREAAAVAAAGDVATAAEQPSADEGASAARSEDGE